MDRRNGITAAILLFFVVADVSNASSFWKLRYLADESPSKNGTAVSTPPPSNPSPSPLSGSGSKKSNPKPDNSSKLDPNPVNKTDSVTPYPPPEDKKVPKLSDKPEKVSPPPEKEIGSGKSSPTSNSKNDKVGEKNGEKKKNVDSGKNTNSTDTKKGTETKEHKNQDQKEKEKKEKKNGDESESKPEVVETCDSVATSCRDGSTLTACIKDFGIGSKELAVLVHNSGGKLLNVNLAGLSGESFPKVLKVPKNGTKSINISLTDSKSSKLVLNAGNGDCVLPLNPLVSKGSFYLNLPSYDKFVTPVNGAYLLIVTVVIFGGSWACCMFRKRRRHDGIPYQELEMGLPESMEATEIETAEGWDQGWDDDWDEDNAVKSPAVRHVANISANGLTARSSNRDGWENNWDE